MRTPTILTVVSLIAAGALSCVPEAESSPEPTNQVVENQDEENQLPSDHETENHVWQWIEVEGTACGNGTVTGMGVSDGSDVSRIMIFLAGGGACWDTASCYWFNSAVNIETTFNEARFQNEIAQVERSGLVDRETGPFGDAPLVYLPYCTADFHSGDNVGAYDPLNPDRTIQHHGAANLDAYAARLAEVYPDVEEVFLVGVSAGGYGALMNHHRFKAAFPEANVHVLADGSPMVQPRDGRWGTWKRAWNMQFPPGCEVCEGSFEEYAAHVVEASQESRFALLTYNEDAVVALYFSYNWGLDAAIQRVVEAAFPGSMGDRASAFRRAGNDHVMLQRYENLRDDDGVRLEDFVHVWANGSPPAGD